MLVLPKVTFIPPGKSLVLSLSPRRKAILDLLHHSAPFTWWTQLENSWKRCFNHDSGRLLFLLVISQHGWHDLPLRRQLWQCAKQVVINSPHIVWFYLSLFMSAMIPTPPGVDMLEHSFRITAYLLQMNNRPLLYDTMMGQHQIYIKSRTAQGSILGPNLWNVSYDTLLRANMPE